MSISSKCPLCGSPVRGRDAGFEHLYDCERCGCFRIPWALEDDLPGITRGIQYANAILSHAVRRMQTRGGFLELTQPLIDRILKEDKLPTPRQQADNAVLWLGQNLGTVDDRSDVQPFVFASIIGAVNADGAQYIVNHLAQEGLVASKSWGSIFLGKPAGNLGLTFKGWAIFETLRKVQLDSSTAFMAMKFGNAALTEIFRNHFKPAVLQAGFELKRLDEGQTAGIIDNRMRAEIQVARFLVADLSDHNNGAYWEAGFAEGLGKPVFYTCDATIFEKERPHFDTEHHLTIKWDQHRPQAAAEELKAAIRATLRGESKLQDD